MDTNNTSGAVGDCRCAGICGAATASSVSHAGQGTRENQVLSQSLSSIQHTRSAVPSPALPVPRSHRRSPHKEPVALPASLPPAPFCFCFNCVM